MSGTTPECSIIIPVCNKWELTQNCLVSLRDHSAGHDLEVVVVDNGSRDATMTELAPLGASLFGTRFVPVVFPENRNFGPACNAGAEVATAPLLFFLNNDTLVTPGWAGPLLTAMCGYDTPGALGPLLLYEDDTVQHLGVALGSVGPLHLYQGFPRDHPVVARQRDVQFITGAAMMIARDFFLDCGSFFEEYRNGFEDLDLCIIIRQRGKTIRCLPESVIYHLESQTPGRKDSASEDNNGQVLLRRHGNDIMMDLHQHALRDGFVPYVNDLLAISIAMQAEEEAALAEGIEEKSLGEVYQLCLNNPFWVRGREVMAQQLTQAGKANNALIFLLSLAEIDPSLKRYRDLLRYASRADGGEWKATVERHLGIIASRMADFQATRGEIKRILRKSAPDDTLVRQIYYDKLVSMFPEAQSRGIDDLG